MKKVLLILFTIHCSLFTVNAQRLTVKNAQRLTVKNTTIDVGATGYEQPVTATFELRNKGLRRLVIESVRPDCGCTKIEYPKEVGMGEKFIIRMTYDARQLGHFQKMCQVKSNGTKKPFYLTMKGVVKKDMRDYSGEYPVAMGDLLLDTDVIEFDDVNKGDVQPDASASISAGHHQSRPSAARAHGHYHCEAAVGEIARLRTDQDHPVCGSQPRR